MIALPCSTEGTVTGPVERRLEQFSLPHPGPMTLGQVEIRPLDDGDQLAQYVALACSVDRFSSNLEAIARIGEALGTASCELDAVESVSAPLLGTGAGGMAAADVVAALREGFVKTSSPHAVLSMFVLDAEDYEQLAHVFVEETGAGEAHATSSGSPQPRVFISHTALSPARQDWLEELYRFLRRNGVNARLDSRSLRPGMDLVQWMCNELEQAHRVLLICDDRYSDRADGRHGGVGWETMLIQGDLYAAMYGESSGSEYSGSKYVPIVLTEDPEQGRPTYLKTKLVLHWPDGADEQLLRERLLDELYGVDTEEPLGPIPARYRRGA
jgi:hypothetical protein